MVSKHEVKPSSLGCGFSLLKEHNIENYCVFIVRIIGKHLYKRKILNNGNF